MLLTVEGPDRVGKSTLVNEIRKQILATRRNAVTFHRGAPKPGDHPLTDYALPISVYTPGRTATSIVTDRLHLGDLTYGPIYRGECRQTMEMVHFTNALIDARGGVKVHLTAAPQLIRQRIEAEGEENSYLKLADVGHVVDIYRQVCDTGWIDIDTTNWTRLGDTVKAARKLVEIARECEDAFLPIYQVDQDYVGPTKPRALLVGEDSSATRTVGDTAPDARPSYGAFTPWEGSAGEYLIRTISEAGMDLSYDVGMTTTTSLDLNTLHARLGRPRIIALGDLAVHAVHAAGLSVGVKMNHPAHEMHFNPKKHQMYALSIRRAVPFPEKKTKTAAQAFGG